MDRMARPSSVVITRDAMRASGKQTTRKGTNPMAALTRRGLLGAAALMPLCSPAFAAFPDQPLRVIVPWNPGGWPIS